jgi:SIR2-like domain
MNRLAPGLLAAGVLGVVAMRYAMADADAVRFSQTFYHQLLRGACPGALGVAAQLARKALLENASRDERRGFVAPVVHTADPRGVFFEIRGASDKPAVVQAGAGTDATLVPIELLEAIGHRRCVPIVGADLVAAPASRRGPVVPGLRSLVEALATEARATDAETCDDVDAAPMAPDAALRRLAERYDACGKWRRMVEIVRDFYAPQPPSDLHRSIASWPVPGIFYTHFDGLMEAARSALDRMTIVRNLTDGGDPTQPLLVLVRGTINDHNSLVLTENDHFELAERIERMHSSLVSLTKGHFGRCVLFLGISPADSVARQLARRLLEVDGRRGPQSFFVSNRHSSGDEWYWQRFNVSFIRAETDAFVRAVSAISVRM